MATKMIQIDDYDGKSEGAEPFFFSLNDRFWRIDLVGANRKKIEDFLAPFIDKAQPTDPPKGGKRTPATEYTNGFGDPDPAEVRAWAKAQDPPIPVNEKGRVPDDVTRQYKQAMAEAARAGQQ